MDKKQYECRSYNFDIRAEQNEKGHIITGRPVVYGQKIDLVWFDEVIDPGALDETDLKDVRFLVNHDLYMIPLARSRRNNGNSTMKLSKVTEGLDIDYISLDTENNATARALYSAVERRDISGMSFRFTIDGERWEGLESDHPTRHMTKIGRITEVSACTFPAYDETEINARSTEALESARAALESARTALESARQNGVNDKAAANAAALALEREKILILTKE